MPSTCCSRTSIASLAENERATTGVDPVSVTSIHTRLACLTIALLAASCERTAPPAPVAPSAPPSTSAVRRSDEALAKCRAKATAIAEADILRGAPRFTANRPYILGRARGEPVVFTAEPKATPSDQLDEVTVKLAARFAKSHPVARLRRLLPLLRGKPAEFRKLILRDGYVFATDPIEAFALVRVLRIAHLFEEESIWLQRAGAIAELKREQSGNRPARYVYVTGAHGYEAGAAAELLFADRFALTKRGLDAPLHRSLSKLTDELGADRVLIQRMTELGATAELRFGELTVTAVLEHRDAELRLGCINETAEQRAKLERHRESTAFVREARRRMRRAVDGFVRERLRFDRPVGEKTADRDGELRPAWRWAYRQGRRAFSVDDASYMVFDGKGRPAPPQVCVDLVLESYERAAGTWFAPLGQPRQRTKGTFDWNDYEIKNRRGVIALEKFATEHEQLFSVFKPELAKRVPFAQRRKFFDYLVANASLFRPGDVLAIRGIKNDGKIHQHAILLERTDPVTGMPFGLADQMKWPRRRSWEGIMAEAPRRSFYFRARPTDAVFRAIAGDAASAPTRAAKADELAEDGG